MAAQRVLLRNALVIDTEPDPSARPHTDVLIEGDRIAAVGAGLPDSGAMVVDATDRIVLPGFVDTHRHTWQTALRSVAVDADLGTYLHLVLGRMAPLHRPEDVHTATLAGALECLDSGITTLQDFSHIQYTPDHTSAAVSALREAGIRAVFGYGYPVFDADARRPDAVRKVRSGELSNDDALVTMALATVGPSHSPLDVVKDDWGLARELGVRIALHASGGAVATLAEHGLLGPDTLYVHGNTFADTELEQIAQSGGAVSVTPAVEARMGHGAPVIGRLRRAGVTTGLGVDVVTTVAGDMFSLMRAALLASHLGEGEPLTAAGALRMATIDGAAALGLADRVGSLRPGRQADLIVLRANDLNLAGAHDPIGAVVTAAHPGNVDTVLVAGRAVKRDGQLLHSGLSGLTHALTSAARRLSPDATMAA